MNKNRRLEEFIFKLNIAQMKNISADILNELKTKSHENDVKSIKKATDIQKPYKGA
jgi:hypothetical protein